MENSERIGSRFGDQVTLMCSAAGGVSEGYPTVLFSRPMSPTKVNSVEADVE